MIQCLYVCIYIDAPDCVKCWSGREKDRVKKSLRRFYNDMCVTSLLCIIKLIITIGPNPQRLFLLFSSSKVFHIFFFYNFFCSKLNHQGDLIKNSSGVITE